MAVRAESQIQPSLSLLCPDWGIITFLDILRFYAELYCEMSLNIGLALAVSDVTGGQRETSDRILVELIQNLETMKAKCDSVGLTATNDAIGRVVRTWNANHDRRTFWVSCPQIGSILQEELQRRICLIIPKASQEQYENPAKDWEEILAKFPQAKDDVIDMNRCRAFRLHGAAIFHAMLVVEHGLIDLGKLIGVKDKKPGWDATHKKMKEVLALGHKKCPVKLRKHFQILELIGQSLESMKMAWRNKISHADKKLVILTSDFSENVAEEVIAASRGFMRLLATSGIL